jgi:hypothetical protein
MNTCNHCEYFDRYNDDCLNSNSPRFQTKATEPACVAFYPDTTEAHCLSCGHTRERSAQECCGH